MVSNLRDPALTLEYWPGDGAAAHAEGPSPYHHRLTIATEFQPLWDELFPSSRSRIVRLLV